MKKLGFLVLALTFIISCVHAQPANMGAYDAGLLNSQYMKDMKSFDRKTRAEKELKKTGAYQAPQAFVVQSIHFENNKAFTSEQLEKVLSYTIGTELTQQGLTDMKKTLTRFYQQNGYYAALISVSNKKIDDHSITFSIEEGPKNAISIDVE